MSSIEIVNALIFIYLGTLLFQFIVRELMELYVDIRDKLKK